MTELSVREFLEGKPEAVQLEKFSKVSLEVLLYSKFVMGLSDWEFWQGMPEAMRLEVAAEGQTLLQRLRGNWDTFW